MKPAVIFTAVFTTFFMTGLIWFVQVVHYPLFNSISAEAFPSYEKAHTFLTGLIVGPVMIAELVSIGFWTFLTKNTNQKRLLGIALAITIFIWFSTFIFQMPAHNLLSLRWDSDVIQNLVTSNWIRTLLWTLKSGFLVGVLMPLLSHKND